MGGVHAVELYADWSTLVELRFQDYALDSDCQVEVEDLEGSKEDISFEATLKLSPDHIVDQFVGLVLFYGDHVTLLQFNRFLSFELEDNGLVPFASELVENMFRKVAVVDATEKSGLNIS